MKRDDAQGGRKMRILLVEDDKTIAGGLQYSLRSEGFEVVICEDKESAMGVIAVQSFDLYLLDLALPDGSGYDLCEVIKAE